MMTRFLKTSWYQTKRIVPGFRFTLFCIGAIAVSHLVHGRYEYAFNRFVILFYAVVYGGGREAACFPIARYGWWLIHTPWTWRKRLPLGPIWLVWQDLFVLAILTVVYRLENGTHQQLFPLEPVMWFLLALGAVQTARLSGVGEGWFSLAGLLGLAAVSFLWPDRTSLFILALAIYAVTTWGLCRSLRRFPWIKLEPIHIDALTEGHYPMLAAREHAKDSYGASAVFTAIVLSSMVYVFVNVGRKLPPFMLEGASEFFRVIAPLWVFAVVYVICILFSILFFWAKYHRNKRAPIGLLTRIRTGQFIIPGYDRIRIPVIAVLVVSPALPWMMIQWGASLRLTFAVSFTLSMACYFLAPSLKNWELTGHYRLMLPGAKAKPDEAKETRARSSASRMWPTWLRVYPRTQTAVFIGALAFSTACGFLSAPAGFLLALFSMFAFVLFYGAARVQNFHPAFWPEYVQWLKTQPWHPGRPLPFGPVGLVWPDLLLVLPIGVFVPLYMVLFHAKVDDARFLSLISAIVMASAAAIFLFVYSAVAIPVLYAAGRRITVCAMMIALLSLLLLPGFYWAAVILLALGLISSVALRESLMAFPWPGIMASGDARKIEGIQQFFGHLFFGKIRNLRALNWYEDLWEVGRLQSYLFPKTVAIPDAGARVHLAISLVCGWFAFVVTRLYMKCDHGHGAIALYDILYFSLVGFLFFCRWHVYANLTNAPSNFAGRLATGRPIVWRHDMPFLVTFGLAAAACALPFLIAGMGLPKPLAMGVSVFITRSLFAFVGPGQLKWRLTGAHRMPGFRAVHNR